MNEKEEPIDFSEEHARQVLRDHITMIAKRSFEKYGPAITMDVMERVLADRDIIRRETTWRFDNSILEAGEFAMAVAQGDSYVIAVHDLFKENQESLPWVIAYHLATVNYGEHVIESDEAELFGASLLGMDVEEYYEKICLIIDNLAH
ncbi:MAG: hypothetical protein H8E86_08195 [Planctomycetes bacterium]|nr:hypothetical protein [Planctomycetota bacterium]